MVENRQLIYIISMFMIVQFAGLIIASQVFAGVSASQLPLLQISSSFSNSEYLIVLIVMIFVFSFVLSLIFKLRKPVKLGRSDRFFTLFEIFIVGYTTYILVLLAIVAVSGTSVLNVLFEGNPSTGAFILASLVALAVVGAKLKWPKLRNLTAITSSIGAGLTFGMLFGLALSFWLALLFMAMLAVYDFISVFVTKHMVTLANAAVGNNLSLMVMVNEVEAVPASYLSKSELIDYVKSKREIASKGPITQAVMNSGMVPISARTALGTGDMMASLMLAVSAYTVYWNFTLSLVVVAGSVLGLCLTMYVLKKYKRPLPAIPFLLLGIGIALGIFFLASLI